MKKIIIILASGVAAVGVMTALVGAKFDMFNNDVVVMKEEPQVIVEVEQVDSLEVLIKEAQETAKEGIETDAQTAYDAVYEDKMREVSDSIKAEYIAKIEATISSESYWRERDRVKRMIYETFPESPRLALAVAECESSLLMVQSRHMQPYGREESFGIFQVHARAWDDVAKDLGLDYKNDIRDNIKMARYIFDQSGSFQPWTCYTKHIAMR